MIRRRPTIEREGVNNTVEQHCVWRSSFSLVHRFFSPEAAAHLSLGNKMKPCRYDTHWNESANWKWGLFYVCEDDPRVIVPKKPKWTGRTLNFAHRKAFLVLFFTLLAATMPLAFRGDIGSGVWGICYWSVIVGIVVFYYSFELREK